MPFAEIPLVACATGRSQLADHIQGAARKLGYEFFCSESFNIAVQACEQHCPSCLVVEYESNIESAIEHNRKKSNIYVPIFMVVPSGDLSAAFRAGQTGALDILEANDPVDNALAYLQAVVDSVKKHQQFESFSDALYHEVTSREKKILGCLLAGEPNKRVASMLDIGLRTVEAGRASLMKKMCVNSFAELIVRVTAIENERPDDVRQTYESLRNGAIGENQSQVFP